MDTLMELQAILARLSPARRASLLDYARYLIACEEADPLPTPAEPLPDDADVADVADVVDDCRRRDYPVWPGPSGGLMGREP